MECCKRPSNALGVVGWFYKNLRNVGKAVYFYIVSSLTNKSWLALMIIWITVHTFCYAGLREAFLILVRYVQVAKLPEQSKCANSHIT